MDIETINSDLDYLIQKYKRLNSTHETYRRAGIIDGLKIAKAVFAKAEEAQSIREAR